MLSRVTEKRRQRAETRPQNLDHPAAAAPQNETPKGPLGLSLPRPNGLHIRFRDPLLSTPTGQSLRPPAGVHCPVCTPRSQSALPFPGRLHLQGTASPRSPSLPTPPGVVRGPPSQGRGCSRPRSRTHLLRGAAVFCVHPGVSSELQQHLHGFQVPPEGRSVQRRPAEGALREGLLSQAPWGRPAPPAPARRPPCCWGWRPARPAAGWPGPARRPPPPTAACCRCSPRCPPAPRAAAAAAPPPPRRGPRPRGSAARPPARRPAVSAVSARAPGRPPPPPLTSRRTAWISPTSPSKAASRSRAPRCRSSRRRRSASSAASRRRRAASCSLRTRATKACGQTGRGRPSPARVRGSWRPHGRAASLTSLCSCSICRW